MRRMGGIVNGGLPQRAEYEFGKASIVGLLV
jgi:hypothetical protein